MVQTWGQAKGADFTCPHCGAVYETTLHRSPARDSDNARCVVCKDVMDEWNSTTWPSYQLKQEPAEDGLQEG